MSATLKKGIDKALSREPVVMYIVNRHGKFKRCLTRDTAIKHLAYAMADRIFWLINKQPRKDDVWNRDHNSWGRGELTDEYIIIHFRCMLRVRELLAKKKVNADWCKKHDSLANKYQSKRDLLTEKYKGEFEKLNAEKPF